MAELDGSHVMQKVIKFLSSILQREAETNDVFRSFDTQKISINHGLTRPTISLQCYMERISSMRIAALLVSWVAYIYLDRFSQKQPLLPINSFNVHRLLIASVLISAKFMDDDILQQCILCKSGRNKPTEMNLLEVDFLFGVGFQLNVSPSTFHTYCSHLQREMLLESPPLIPSPFLGRTEHFNHHCINEEESTHQHELAV